MKLLFLAILLNLYYNILDATKTPIIGILSQELTPTMKRDFPQYQSYIAASYVKFVESSGARVVPIFINQTEHYYRTMVKSLNGILLPGGNSKFNKNGGYAKAGYKIYNLVKQENDIGSTYPIIGICLGFELLMYMDNDKKDIRTTCLSENIALPLEFKNDFKNSKIFKYAPQKIIDILSSQPVTFNSHVFCITETNFTKCGLNNSWRILSSNKDEKSHITFISSLESTKYPYLGLQFHPEKNIFEWQSRLNIPHFPNAITVSRFFSDWLIKQARKNDNMFQNKDIMTNLLIYNFRPTYSGKTGSLFEQVYYFK